MHKCAICKTSEPQIAYSAVELCDTCLGWAVRTEQQAGDQDAALKTALHRAGGITVDSEALEAARGRDLVRSVTPAGDVYLTTAPKGFQLYEVPEDEDDS